MGNFDLQIQFDDDSKETAEVYVVGKIQGEVCRFLLDTGCSRTSLNFDDFSSQFEKVGSEESSSIFGKTQYDLIKIGRIEFGEIEENNVVLSRAKIGELDRKLLGMDILKKYRLHFSFHNRKVEINPHLSVNNLTTQELILDKGSIPHIKFEFGNSDVLAVWDTGASVTLVDIRFIEKHQTMFEKVGTEIVTDSTGFKVETPIYIVKPILLGNQEFSAHKVVGVNLSYVNANTEIPMGFVFGYSTLSKANWLFDFPQKKWAILEMISG
jgi:predicted aspartyl protease